MAEEQIPGFKVLVGGAQILKGNTMVRDIPLIIDTTHITISALVLDATRYDIVLGSDWLATLGEHISDYSTSILKIFQNGTWVTLKGERNRLPKVAHFHQMLRLRDTDAIEECYTMEYLGTKEMAEDAHEEVHPKVRPEARMRPEDAHEMVHPQVRPEASMRRNTRIRKKSLKVRENEDI
ncbi:hypothetical protein K2173_018083 [Erythroxylum novogranatense]|uniref:Uncharacterized protein n=1 Tax=Erythroxylum novogranatense TaxID=1862640 RepID=A0AAV8TUE3_9ROSI|nr:hypothetical protein K2173_018083 [Erythroxylum novogranatense]